MPDTDLLISIKRPRSTAVCKAQNGNFITAVCKRGGHSMGRKKVAGVKGQGVGTSSTLTRSKQQTHKAPDDSPGKAGARQEKTEGGLLISEACKLSKLIVAMESEVLGVEQSVGKMSVVGELV
jgi:hypothetical protein